MLLRNRELGRLLLVYIGAAAALAAAGGVLFSSGVVAVWTAAAACALAVPVAVFTRGRYRALSALAARLDAALSGERDLALDTMREGELAVLASAVDKLFARLVREGDALKAERRRLADALADISHQLKTPLTSLALTVELLERDAAQEAAAAGAPPGALAGSAPAGERRLERLRQAEVLVDRIRWLVSALLKLARVDAGIVRFERAHVSAEELVARALEPLAVAFDAAGVEPVCRIDARAGFVGDVAWTAEALENVLKNCLEHTPPGGEVRVEAYEDALACRVAVEDTGPGIAPEDLPHVFERFYRGRDEAADPHAGAVNPAGVGIGLALAQELVTAQGGTLTAGNAPGGGARFALTFPKTPV